MIIFLLAGTLAASGCGNVNSSPAPGGGSGAPVVPSVLPSGPSSDETIPPGDQPTASPPQSPGASAVAT